MSKTGNKLGSVVLAALLAAGSLSADAGGGARMPTDRSPSAELGRGIALQGNEALRAIRADARRNAQALRPAPLRELARPGTMLARANLD